MWEYTVGCFSRCCAADKQKILNLLGKEGWEIVAISSGYYYAKRRKL